MMLLSNLWCDVDKMLITNMYYDYIGLNHSYQEFRNKMHRILWFYDYIQQTLFTII